MVMCCQILPYGRIFESLFAVSRSPRAHKPHCTHPHRFIPICTHPCQFLPTRPKHHVRGNFPGHRDLNHALHNHLCLFLSCFCVPPCPCTPLHSSKPIRAHLHPYSPVPTLNSTVYMYYLC